MGIGLIDFSLGDIGGMFKDIREAWTGETISDPDKRAEISYKLSQLEHMANQGQIEINKVEAAHDSLFVAGWRPFIGWVCGVAIAYAFVGQPILEWMVSIGGLEVEPPKLNVDTLYQLVLAMLGMATLRTYEKKQKVAREK